MTIYQPSFISPYLTPTSSFQEQREHLEKVNHRYEEILKHIGTLAPSKEVKKKRDWQPLFNNNICNLATYIANNAFGIMDDYFGGHLSSCKRYWSGLEELKVPITQEFKKITRQSTADFHTNIFGLMVIAPTMVILSTLFESPGLAICSGLATLYYAGARTYVFSGDFGVQNFDGRLTLGSGIRLAATHDLQSGFHLLAEYLERKWDEANEEKREEIYAQCVKISGRENWEALLQGLNRGGIHSDFVKAILTPLSTCIMKIKNESINLLGSRSDGSSREKHQGSPFETVVQIQEIPS